MKHRIFISINMPKELKKIVEKYIEPFRENEMARVAENDNWHLTVVFCGYLDNEKLERLKETARKIANEIKSFELVPDKIIFAPAKNPRMVWLTFKYSQEFISLAKNFIDFNYGNFRPNPHITLVRFQEQHYSNLKSLLPPNGIDLKNETKSFIVESINIMESRLSQLGPKYELICQNYLK